ncbi:hypothetical protein POM88_011138 [Heracleum sosnowskyi]|uniref:Uncharacterized protein n=1 Tax=Heracleum sosnowskyi TaxID=360622 RepID=A0AAD8IXD4_9APIA|nr:hypothetical protein POM88_011138 [Heracleum sosnowskyi]
MAINKERIENLEAGLQIVESMGLVDHRLNLPSFSRVHLVLHDTPLKLGGGSAETSSKLPPRLMFTLPKLILDTGQVHIAGRVFNEMAKWQGMSLGDATWEQTDMLQQRLMNMCKRGAMIDPQNKYMLFSLLVLLG